MTEENETDYFGDLCEKITELCYDSLTNMDVVDVMDALSIVKNRIINDSIFAITETKVEELFGNITNINHKNNEKSNVGA